MNVFLSYSELKCLHIKINQKVTSKTEILKKTISWCVVKKTPGLNRNVQRNINYVFSSKFELQKGSSFLIDFLQLFSVFKYRYAKM